MLQDVELEATLEVARLRREAEATVVAKITADQLGEAFQPEDSDHDEI